MSRRTFLLAGVVWPVVPRSLPVRVLPPSWTFPDPDHDAEEPLRVLLRRGRPAVRLHAAVFDRRFSDGFDFAGEMRRLNVPAHGVDGDVTDFWFRELDLRWKAGPAPVAGLTAYGPLFCLERLAWDRGMRVVYRGRHTQQAGGGVEHVLSGPGILLAHGKALSQADPIWTRQVARLATRCPQGRRPPVATTIVSPAAPAVSLAAAPTRDRAEPLWSWVLA